MDLHSELSLIATVSVDGSLRIWSLSSNTWSKFIPDDIRLLSEIHFGDAPLTGVQFMKSFNGTLAVAVYDVNELSICFQN